jgi:hypothetical protein
MPESANKVVQNEAKYQIGFNLRSFISIIDVEFDKTTMQVTKTTNYIKLPMAEAPTGKIGDDFMVGSFPMPDVYNLYKKEIVKEKMTKELGANNEKKYFQSIISRGHLTPRSDFVFKSQRRATHYYLNCNPQFQGFNGNNWAVVEDSIRKYLTGTKVVKNVKIETGVKGILELPDQTGANHKIFLAANGKVPVPLYFWKTMEVENESKYAFIGINHPNADLPELEHYKTILDAFCPDAVCDSKDYKWKKAELNQRNRNDLKRGVVRCCDFNKFKEWLNKK